MPKPLSKHFASLHLLSSHIQSPIHPTKVGDDPHKQQHQEWQVAGPIWPFCSVCVHTPVPAKCTRALFDRAMPALIPAGRVEGQLIITMRICGEKRQKHISFFPENFTLKRTQINT